jgi:hypothetical protein
VSQYLALRDSSVLLHALCCMICCEGRGGKGREGEGITNSSRALRAHIIVHLCSKYQQPPSLSALHSSDLILFLFLLLLLLRSRFLLLPHQNHPRAATESRSDVRAVHHRLLYDQYAGTQTSSDFSVAVTRRHRLVSCYSVQSLSICMTMTLTVSSCDNIDGSG